MWGGLCMFIVFQGRFVKVENLRGIPGEEAQLSTSTVTEETDTELGRLSTLTLVGAQFGVSNQHKFSTNRSNPGVSRRVSRRVWSRA